MKYIGAVLVFTVMTSLGIRISLYLKKREETLDSTVLFLESMMLEIEYSALPLDEIICKYALSKTHSTLNFICKCYDELKKGTDFPLAWSTAVNNCSLYTSEEKGKLLQLGDILGTSDCGGQVSMIKMCRASFERFLSAARSKSESYCGLSIYLGIFCGLGLCVLLI